MNDSKANALQDEYNYNLREQLEKEENEVKKICSENAFNLSLLHDLFELQMKGFNNKQIAEKLGVHRVTIQRYANALRRLKESEFKALYNYILMEKKEDE